MTFAQIGIFDWLSGRQKGSIFVNIKNIKGSSLKSRDNIQKKSMGQTVQFRILNSFFLSETIWIIKPKLGIHA